MKFGTQVMEDKRVDIVDIDIGNAYMIYTDLITHYMFLFAYNNLFLLNGVTQDITMFKSRNFGVEHRVRVELFCASVK